ncbi:SDR family oxidoreductase, partial [Rhizobium ruizarguesonis]
INLTKSIARSFGRESVVAVSIATGWVRTYMAENFVVRHGKDAAVGDIPIVEMAEQVELAELVAFLLRPSQAPVNGVTF